MTEFENMETRINSETEDFVVKNEMVSSSEIFDNANNVEVFDSGKDTIFNNTIENKINSKHFGRCFSLPIVDHIRDLEVIQVHRNTSNNSIVYYVPVFLFQISEVEWTFKKGKFMNDKAMIHFHHPGQFEYPTSKRDKIAVYAGTKLYIHVAHDVSRKLK